MYEERTTNTADTLFLVDDILPASLHDVLHDLWDDFSEANNPMVLRDAAGRYRVIAEELPEHSDQDARAYRGPERNSIWEDLASASATKYGRPDPGAIRVGYEYQRRYRPIATLVFGSRSRGDHRTDSDLDVISVNPDEYWERNPALGDHIKRLTREHCGAKADVHHYKWRHYLMNAACRNTFTAEALLHGIVFGNGEDIEHDHILHLRRQGLELPEYTHFVSEYAGDDPPPPKYMWGLFARDLLYARHYLRLVQIEHTGKMPTGRSPRYMRELEERACEQVVKRPEEARLESISIRAGYAINHLLTALLRTYAGEFPRILEDDSTRERLIALAGRIHAAGAPRIEWARYEFPCLLRELPRAELVESVLHDTELLRKMANTRKRRIDRDRREYEVSAGLR